MGKRRPYRVKTTKKGVQYYQVGPKKIAFRGTLKDNKQLIKLIKFFEKKNRTKAKKEAPPGEKPQAVNTHLRDMIILPEMIGSVVGVYNGKVFNAVEIKPDMVGFYLGEFSITYRPIRHGRPGIGATNSSRFIPLK